MNSLGAYVRARRQALQAVKPGYSIRKLAERLGMHHSYLSKLERGEPASLSEARIRDLARELEEDPDILLAMAGKLSEAMQAKAAEHPRRFLQCLRNLDQAPPEPDAADLPALLEDEISERRTLERKLRRLEAERDAILDNLKDAAVAYLDRDLNLIWASKSVSRYLSCPCSEALGRKCYEAVQNRAAPCPDCIARKAVETGEVQEGRHTSQDGRSWVVRSVPLLDAMGQVDRVVHSGFDVTELEQAQHALAESEQRWRLALEGGQLGVWELGGEGASPYFSPHWLAMLGYDPDDLENLPSLPDLLHPEDRDRVLGKVHRLIVGETDVFDSEHRLLCKDGSWKWVHARGAAVNRDETGRAQRISGIMLDAHQQKTTALKLQESEARYRDLFEQAPIGVYTATAEGEYLSVNPRHAEMYGFASPEDMLARVRNVREMYADPKDRDRLLRKLQRRDVVSNFECQMRRKDGSLLWTSRTLRTERDAQGRLTSYMGFVKDIQAAKEAEQASDQARRQLLGVMEQVEAGVFVVDPASDRIIYANPFLKNELGFEVLDRSPSALLADGRDCPFCLDEQTFIQFGDSISRELLFRNGHWHLCRAKVAPWPGMPRAVLVVATDITEIKQAQEIRDDVDRIMRHDLKSPLSGVISIPDLILDSVELPAEETRLLRAVQTAGRKMLSLINASLILYKLETEDYTIQRDNVDVLGLLHQVVDEVRASHVGYQVTVRIRTQGRPVQAGERFEVPGDPTLLSFTFSNLVKNAMEASEPSSAVDVDLEADERELRITIRNPGRVPPEIEDRFFDKYATAGKTGGAGLGTYSAKLFTQAHGGDIAMRTSEAEGTVLTVTLPR